MESTDPGKSTAMVVWKDPLAVDTNGKDLELMCRPFPGSEFQIGETEVKCFAVDDNKEELACTFLITINGKLRAVERVTLLRFLFGCILINRH